EAGSGGASPPARTRETRRRRPRRPGRKRVASWPPSALRSSCRRKSGQRLAKERLAARAQVSPVPGFGIGTVAFDPFPEQPVVAVDLEAVLPLQVETAALLRPPGGLLEPAGREAQRLTPPGDRKLRLLEEVGDRRRERPGRGLRREELRLEDVRHRLLRGVVETDRADAEDVLDRAKEIDRRISRRDHGALL